MATILTHPTSITKRDGTSVSFTVIVSQDGDPNIGPSVYDNRITYNWEVKIPGGSWQSANRIITKNTAISSTWGGANRFSVYSDTFTINAALNKNNREYRCVIRYQTRNYGLNVNLFETLLYSNSATLTVIDRIPLFNTSTFSLITDTTRRNALISAANRWNSLLKYPAKFINDNPGYLGCRLMNYSTFDQSAPNPKTSIVPYNNIVNSSGHRGVPYSATPIRKMFMTEFNLQTNIQYHGVSFLTQNDWTNIFTHELGYVLGIGLLSKEHVVISNSIGGFSVPALPLITDVKFPETIRGYNRIANNKSSSLGLWTALRKNVPVEKTGSGKNLYNHWENNYIPDETRGTGSPEMGYIIVSRESFNGIINEIITKNFGVDKIISSLSIGCLKDIGYEEMSPGSVEAGTIIVSNTTSTTNNPA
jgi:hypothetical protein